MQISCELFYTLPFPLFVTDESGKVIFKNIATQKYIPNIRCGTKIASHLTDSEGVLSGKERFACLGNIQPYHYAFVIRNICDDKPVLAFAFFPDLQFGNVERMKEIISGLDPASLFGFSKFLPRGHRTNRIYGDIDSCVASIGNGFDDSVRTFDIENIIKPFSEKLCGAFGALGFSIHSEIDKSVGPNRFCMISPTETVFVISRAIYAAARASEDGRIFLFSTYDEKQDAITVTAKTKSKIKVTENDICLLAPECVYESAIFKAMHGEGYPSVSDDGNGNVSVTFAFPCKQSLGGTYILRATDDFGTLDKYIEKMANEVYKMLGDSKK